MRSMAIGAALHQAIVQFRSLLHRPGIKHIHFGDVVVSERRIGDRIDVHAFRRSGGEQSGNIFRIRWKIVSFLDRCLYTICMHGHQAHKQSQLAWRFHILNRWNYGRFRSGQIGLLGKTPQQSKNDQQDWDQRSVQHRSKVREVLPCCHIGRKCRRSNN